jgi:hypothetical protein
VLQQQQHAGLATDAAAAQQQDQGMPSSKRHQSMLNSAISRLGGQPAATKADSPQEHAAAAPFSAQAAANPQQPHAHTALQQMQLPQQQQQQVDASGSSWQPSHTAHEPTPHLASADSTATGRGATGGHVMSVEAAGAVKQQGQQQQQPAAVVVPACGADCQHTLTQGWCHSQVGLPSCDHSSSLHSVSPNCVNTLCSSCFWV